MNGFKWLEYTNSHISLKVTATIMLLLSVLIKYSISDPHVSFNAVKTVLFHLAYADMQKS